MMTARPGFNEIIKRGLLAGAAGGLAEIVWVSLYATMTGGNAATLARGVTTAAGVTALLPATPVSVGIAWVLRGPGDPGGRLAARGTLD